MTIADQKQKEIAMKPCARCLYHYNLNRIATTKRGTMHLCNGCALQFDQDCRRRAVREAVEMANKKKR